MKKNSSHPYDKEISRRTLIEWLGKGAVLSLLPFLSSGCADSPDLDNDNPETKNSIPKQTIANNNANNFPFAPGTKPHIINAKWNTRTVDQQNLQNILDTWTLKVFHHKSKPITLTFEDIVNLSPVNLKMDFHCVEGWSVYDIPWNGVHISTLMELISVPESATHITFHTIGGDYNESLPLDVALEPHTFLAYGIDNMTLPLKRGFPLRLIVPRMMAYKSAKYIAGIEFTDHPENGFWVKRGYPYDAPVQESRLRKGRY